MPFMQWSPPDLNSNPGPSQGEESSTTINLQPTFTPPPNLPAGFDPPSSPDDEGGPTLDLGPGNIEQSDPPEFVLEPALEPQPSPSLPPPDTPTPNPPPGDVPPGSKTPPQTFSPPPSGGGGGGGNIPPFRGSYNPPPINTESILDPVYDIEDELGDLQLPESLLLDLQNANFDPVAPKGMSQQIPEILVVSNFEPIFSKASNLLGAFGKLLNFQIDVNQLKTDNILSLIQQLKTNGEIREVIRELERKYDQEILETNKDIEFAKSIILNLSIVKENLNLRSNTGRIKTEITNLKEIPTSKNLREIFTDDLGFSDKGYDQFLNTKLLAQMASDLNSIILNYSPLIFEQQIHSRITDINSIKIRNFENFSNLNFKVGNLTITPFSMSNVTDWTLLFASSLPSKLEDKLTLLSLIVAKEFSTSAGLSQESTGNLLHTEFEGATTNRNGILAAIGQPGDTVLDPVLGNNSVASFFRIKSDDQIILPFELQYVNNNNKSYVPGSVFFVDRVIKNKTGINSLPLDIFTRRFKTAVENLELIIDNTILMDNIENEAIKDNLLPANLFKNILKDILSVLKRNTVRVRGQGLRPQKSLALNLALMKELETNMSLKKEMFQIVFALGLSLADENNPENVNNFFVEIKKAGASEEEFVEFLQSSFPFISNLTEARIALSSAIAANIRNKFIGGGRVFISYSDFIRAKEELGTNEVFVQVDTLERTFQRELLAFPSIFSQVVNFIKNLDINARELIFSGEPAIGIKSYFSNDKPGKTKFNEISSIYIVWMIFDLYVSVYNKLLNYKFFTKKHPPRRNVLINGTTNNLENAIAAIESILEPNFNFLPFSGEVGSEFDLNRQAFNSVLTRLDSETSVIRDITNTFSAIASLVRTSSLRATDFFTENEDNQKRFNEIQANPDGRDRLATLNEAQVSVSRAMLEEFKQARTNVESPFLDDTFINSKQKNSLMSLLKNGRFKELEGFNGKIVSVGLPAGFLETLNSRLDTFNVGANLSVFESELKKDADVIRINIYKQDLQFEDIVFKPKTYIFEMSRFILGNSLNTILSDNLSFDQLIEKIETKNILFRGSPILNEKLSDIENLNRYSFLTSKQKKEMFQNHIENYLLNLYSKLITGMNISEREFILNDAVATALNDKKTIEIFKKILTTHVSGIAGRAITFTELRKQNKNIDNLLKRIEENKVIAGVINDITVKFDDLSKSANIQISEGIKSFLRIFSHRSVLFGAGAMRQKIVSPKMFERIFNIFVDPDDFEIDVAKTNFTKSGKDLWNKDIVKEEKVE